MGNIENRPAVSSILSPDTPIPPPVLGIVDLLKKMGYNPNFEKDQSAIINNLSTAPVEKALPKNLKDIYDIALRQQTPHLYCKFNDKTEVKIDSEPNNIISVRHLTPEKKLLGIFRKFAIKNYFMVDSATGKAWDVSQLWQDVPTTENEKRNPKPTQVFSLPDLFNAGFVTTKDGPTLVLNRLSEHKKKDKIIKKIGLDGLAIVDNLIPIHESAHRVRHNRDSSTESLDASFFYDYIARFTLKFTEPLFRLAIVFSKWAGGTQELRVIKHYIVESERNAHAFYLNTVRRLKELGVDINRNIPYQSVHKVIDYALGTYDKHSPIRFLPGLGYSEEVRKKQRLKERHKHQVLSLSVR